jgi:hypothetical protein
MFNTIDYQKGREEETKILPELRLFLNDPLLSQCSDRYATFDFESPTNVVEFKRRYVNKATYPDSMIGENKITVAYNDHSTLQYWFVFKFNDGVYYWKHDRTTLLEQRIGGRRDRGADEIKKYRYIPTKLLRPLKEII